MGSGVSAANISIEILSDNAPELDEHFVVELTRVEVVGVTATAQNQPRIGSPSSANVTILSNDQPYGLFQLALAISDPGSAANRYTIIEPESGNTAVTLYIDRKQGKLQNYVFLFEG